MAKYKLNYLLPRPDKFYEKLCKLQNNRRKHIFKFYRSGFNSDNLSLDLAHKVSVEISKIIMSSASTWYAIVIVFLISSVFALQIDELNGKNTVESVYYAMFFANLGILTCLLTLRTVLDYLGVPTILMAISIIVGSIVFGMLMFESFDVSQNLQMLQKLTIFSVVTLITLGRYALSPRALLSYVTVSAEWSKINLLDLLPYNLRGPIVRVSAMDHYISVTTTYGTHFLRMKFSDALKHLAVCEGFQTHRSHWVSKHAISAVETIGNRSFVVGDAFRIPLSSKYSERVLKHVHNAKSLTAKRKIEPNTLKTTTIRA